MTTRKPHICPALACADKSNPACYRCRGTGIVWEIATGSPQTGEDLISKLLKDLVVPPPPPPSMSDIFRHPSPYVPNPLVVPTPPYGPVWVVPAELGNGSVTCATTPYMLS